MIQPTHTQLTDSIALANLQQHVDSLTHKMIELSSRLNTTEIGTRFFESILSQQQNLFGIMASVFTLVVLVGLGVSYWWYFRRIESQLSELRGQTTTATNLVNEIPDMKSQLMTTYVDARRALYEGSPPYQHWKVIWHIRYCEAFIKSSHKGYLDDVNWHFVNPNVDPNNIAEEYHQIKSDSQLEFHKFINFTHIGGIKRILREILELAHDPKYKEMRELASEILHDIEKGFEHPNAKSSSTQRTRTPEDNDDF
jgi:hypothetical protein